MNPELESLLTESAKTPEYAAAFARDDQEVAYMRDYMKDLTPDVYLALAHIMEQRSKVANEIGEVVEVAINNLAMIGWQVITEQLQLELEQKDEL